MITTLATPYNASTNTGYGCIEFDSESKQVTNSVQRAVLQGAIEINGYAYKDSFDTLREYFGAQLQISLLGYYIRFKDPYWNKVIADKYGDGVGTLQEQMESVTLDNYSNFKDYFADADIIDFSPFKNIKMNGIVLDTKTNARAAYLKSNYKGGNFYPDSFLNENAYVYVENIYSFNGRYGNNKNVIVIKNCQLIHDYAFRECYYQDIYVVGNNDGSLTKLGFSYASTPNNLHGHIYVLQDEYENYAADANWAKFGDKLQPYDYDADPDNILPEHTGYFVMG